MVQTADPFQAPLRNKLGHAVYGRGQKTRSRLMDAARALLDETAPMNLTISAIAKAAGMSPASFYVHFDDVCDILLAISATLDFGELVGLVEIPWPDDVLRRRAKAFIEAFYRFWGENRRVLAVRNLQSDLGIEGFFDLRYRSALPIIDALAAKIVQANQSGLSFERAWARAGILYAGFEQLCLYPARTHIPERPMSIDTMIDEQVEFLVLALGG